MTLKTINILEYAFGEGEEVIKKRTLCTLSKMSIIVNDPLVYYLIISIFLTFFLTLINEKRSFYKITPKYCNVKIFESIYKRNKYRQFYKKKLLTYGYVVIIAIFLQDIERCQTPNCTKRLTYGITESRTISGVDKQHICHKDEYTKTRRSVHGVKCCRCFGETLYM